MRRATYEFGYRFGLEPGVNPYPNMETIVFSNTIEIPVGSSITVVHETPGTVVDDLKSTRSGPIYLCGGGMFAAALLAAGLINTLAVMLASDDAAYMTGAEITIDGGLLAGTAVSPTRAR